MQSALFKFYIYLILTNIATPDEHFQEYDQWCFLLNAGVEIFSVIVDLCYFERNHCISEKEMAKTGCMKAGLERQYSKITELEMKYQQRFTKDGVRILNVTHIDFIV